MPLPRLVRLPVPVMSTLTSVAKPAVSITPPPEAFVTISVAVLTTTSCGTFEERTTAPPFASWSRPTPVVPVRVCSKPWLVVKVPPLTETIPLPVLALPGSIVAEAGQG